MFVSGEDWVDTGSESQTGAPNEAMRKTRIQLGINPGWRLAVGFVVKLAGRAGGGSTTGKDWMRDGRWKTGDGGWQANGRGTR